MIRSKHVTETISAEVVGLDNFCRIFAKKGAPFSPQITDKKLSIQLKALVRDTLVVRNVLPESPPQVVYSLSDDGKSLAGLILEMEKWGERIAETRGKLIEK